MRPTNIATLPLADVRRLERVDRRLPGQLAGRDVVGADERLALRLGRIGVVHDDRHLRRHLVEQARHRVRVDRADRQAVEVLDHDVLDEPLLLGDLGLERAEHHRLDAQILLGLANALLGDVPEVRRIVGHEGELQGLGGARLRGRRGRPWL